MDYEKEAREIFIKLHPEMLEWARENYPNFSNEDKMFWCSIFPELSESEDERLRKMLIEIVNITPAALAQKNREALLTYLEKQKDAFDNGVQMGIMQEQARREIEGDLKPVEKQDYSGLSDFERAIHRGFRCAGVKNVSVNIIKETAQDCLGQIEPPLWGKEDDAKMIELIISIFQVNHPNGLFKTTDSGDVSVRYIHTSDIISWLKSLRNEYINAKEAEEMD